MTPSLSPALWGIILLLLGVTGLLIWRNIKQSRAMQGLLAQIGSTAVNPDNAARPRPDPMAQGRQSLKATDRIRRDFVANASHELRTPISILYGYLEILLQEKSVSEEWRPAVSQMYEQTARLKKIIDDMIMLSRLEDLETVDQHQYTDMAPLLKSAANNARVLNAQKQHTIKKHIDSDYMLYCDRHEIESLIANLVSNAVRYTPEQGVIAISWKVDSSGGTLSVKDTGIGIAAHDIPRITERFYRTDPARSRETGGTGLGLAIVNHIVNRHQSSLDIRSAPGEGSVFSVRFPPQRIRKNPELVDLLLN